MMTKKTYYLMKWRRNARDAHDERSQLFKILKKFDIQMIEKEIIHW